MRRALPILLIAVLASAAFQPARATPSLRVDPSRHAIVTFPGAIPAGFEAELEALDVRNAMAFPSARAVAVTAPLSVLRVLNDDPRVLDVRAQRRLDFNLYASVEQIDAAAAALPSEYIVNDQTFTRPGVTGAGQTVAVIDTGIWGGHPDLLNKVTKSLQFEFSYTLPPVFIPERRDLVFESLGPSSNIDTWGHGTHVAGIVAGTGAMAAGRENHGVAPGANLVSLAIGEAHNGLVDDVGWEANAMAAIDWLTRHHDDEAFGPGGIRVANNSWSLTGTDVLFEKPTYDPLAAMIRDIVLKEDVIMVFAAGNYGSSEGAIRPPNAVPQVITVANACKAIDSCGEGRISGDSSRGEQVDVTAPGSDIISTSIPASVIGALKPFYGGSYGSTTQEQAQNNAFYTGASGTSMAAPHVAGLVALMLQIDPDLSPADAERILIQTSVDIEFPNGPGAGAFPGHDIHSGWGLVNAEAALRAVHQQALHEGSADGIEPVETGVAA